MTFFQEPKILCKTALSDLQGAWGSLRSTAVDAHPFPDSDRLLFLIDEGMSWENVRNLDNMKKMLLVIKNIAQQAKAPAEILEEIEMVKEALAEVFQAIAEGEKL